MIDIVNKIEFENNCWVGLTDSSKFNRSPASRIRAVTDMASITKGKLGFDRKGKESNNNEDYLLMVDLNSVSSKRLDLYKRLLTESAGKPSVPFEFVPTNFQETLEDLTAVDMNYLYRYSTLKGEGVFTNLRNILKSPYPYMQEQLNSEDQVGEFKVIVGRVPIKVISHLRTHRSFSFLVESSRNRRYLNEVEFWYPSWWHEEFTKDVISIRDKALVDNLKYNTIEGNFKPEEATMELSDRRLVTFAMAAWKQNTNAWDNLFAVRGKDTGTQSIIGTTVNHIKTIIDAI